MIGDELSANHSTGSALSANQQRPRFRETVSTHNTPAVAVPKGSSLSTQHLSASLSGLSFPASKQDDWVFEEKANTTMLTSPLKMSSLTLQHPCHGQMPHSVPWTTDSTLNQQAYSRSTSTIFPVCRPTQQLFQTRNRASTQLPRRPMRRGDHLRKARRSHIPTHTVWTLVVRKRCDIHILSASLPAI